MWALVLSLVWILVIKSACFHLIMLICRVWICYELTARICGQTLSSMVHHLIKRIFFNFKAVSNLFDCLMVFKVHFFTNFWFGACHFILTNLWFLQVKFSKCHLANFLSLNDLLTFNFLLFRIQRLVCYFLLKLNLFKKIKRVCIWVGG